MSSLELLPITIAWSLLFIWWGLRWWPGISLPDGIGMLGTGLILLSLNGARAIKRIPTKSFTSILGILALVLGGLLLARGVLHVPFQLPIFEILLIVLGVMLLSRELLRARKAGVADLR